MSELEVTMPWLSLSNRLMEAITGEPRFFFFFSFFSSSPRLHCQVAICRPLCHIPIHPSTCTVCTTGVKVVKPSQASTRAQLD